MDVLDGILFKLSMYFNYLMIIESKYHIKYFVLSIV